MKYDTFLVDADDTLLDFRASSLLALERVFTALGFGWEASYGDAFFTLNEKLWSSLERRELTRKKLHEIRFPILLKSLGFPSKKGAECSQAYLEELARCPRYIEGAEEFLRTLSDNGRVYLVTNGTEWIQRLRFELIGIEKYIDGAFISQAVGADKPAKAFVDYVTAHIPSYNPQKTVLIGDSLSADIATAKVAGVDSVWVNFKDKPCTNGIKPDCIARNYREILQFLQIS